MHCVLNLSDGSRWGGLERLVSMYVFPDSGGIIAKYFVIWTVWGK